MAPERMMLTRLANTAIDRADTRPILDELVKCASTDVLLYRAEESPLAECQRAEWDPILAWAAEHLGAPLRVAAGIVHTEQSPEMLARLKAAAAGYDAFALTALHAAAVIITSPVLALAIAEGRLGPQEAFALSELEARYQAERWGRDAIAQERALRMENELAAAALFLSLARS